MINFTRPWNANGVLDFSGEESSAPKYPLKIAGVSPAIKSVGLLSQTYTFTIAGMSTTSKAEQTFVTVIQLGISATAQQVTSQHHIEQIHNFGVAALSGRVISDGELDNDINVDRGLKQETIAVSSGSAKTSVETSSKFYDSPKLANELTAKILMGEPLQNSVITLQSNLPKTFKTHIAPLRYGERVSNTIKSINRRLNSITQRNTAPHYDGRYLSHDVSNRYIYPSRSDCERSAKWQLAEALDHQVATDFDNGIASRFDLVSYFEDAINPTNDRPIIVDPPIEPPTPMTDVLNFRDLWNPHGELDFLRIELDALIIMNTVVMYHTSKLGVKTYINPVSWSISNDLDSYAWSLNCSLYDENILSLISTDDVFTLSVNGIEWSFNAFKYKRLSDGQFSGYSVTFVSETQKLGYPIAQPINVSLDTPRGALQLVEETLGSVPLINKGVTEWTLQADTVEFMQAEPKAIISEILKATGAVMLPSVGGDTIIIQPRYKVASWLMDELTDLECDVLLDGNYMITDSGEIRNGTEYNAVTISGEKSGVVTKVVLNGTGGDIEAVDYTTQIHQDHNVGLEYAKKIFSENGTIELAEISVGLDDNLLQSGSIVRIKHANGDRTGVSLGVTVKGDRVENVIQTATIEFRL